MKTFVVLLILAAPSWAKADEVIYLPPGTVIRVPEESSTCLGEFCTGDTLVLQAPGRFMDEPVFQNALADSFQLDGCNTRLKDCEQRASRLAASSPGSGLWRGVVNGLAVVGAAALAATGVYIGIKIF